MNMEACHVKYIITLEHQVVTVAGDKFVICELES